MTDAPAEFMSAHACSRHESRLGYGFFSLSMSCNPLSKLEASPLPSAPQSLASHVRYAALVAAFNLVIAVVLRILVPAAGSFPGIVLYSECIGMSIFALHQCAGFLPLPGSEGLREFERIVIAAPLGLGFGSWVAAKLIGDPASWTMMFNAPRFEIVTTIIASAVIVYFLWSRQRLRDEESAHARAEQLAVEAQLRLLHSQLEPHMLFNTLANLRILVEVDPHRAQTMIDQLISYLRSTLAASRATWTTVDAEFGQLRDYLELMRVRMAERLVFTLEATEAARRERLPPMLLQPLVENAIKHGLEPAVDGGQIHVSASRIDETLVLIVEDSGLGDVKNTGPEGYGLTHVRERLKVLYGNRADMSVAALAPHGYRVRITLPAEGAPT